MNVMAGGTFHLIILQHTGHRRRTRRIKRVGGWPNASRVRSQGGVVRKPDWVHVGQVIGTDLSRIASTTVGTLRNNIVRSNKHLCGSIGAYRAGGIRSAIDGRRTIVAAQASEAAGPKRDRTT